MSLSGPAIGMMINRKIWNGFTNEQKQLHLREAAKISARQAAEDFGIEQQKYLKRVEKEKGVRLVKAEAEGFKKLVERFDALQRDSVIAGAKKFGVENPGAIIDAYRRNLAKWQKLTADVGYDSAKLEKLIWDHIYSKIDVGKL